MVSKSNTGKKINQAITIEDDTDQGKYKKDKSLGILCQQFIGLFVAWRRVISLEEAAREISRKDIEE